MIFILLLKFSYLKLYFICLIFRPNQVPDVSRPDEHHSSLPVFQKHTRDRSTSAPNTNQNENLSKYITWKTNHDNRQSRTREKEGFEGSSKS